MALPGSKIVDEFENVKLHFFPKKELDFRPRSLFIDGDVTVMEGLPYPIEFVYGEVPTDTQKFYNLRQSNVCESMEGTSILIFWHNNSWFVSTHKRLDAFRSYWADRTNTFGRSFAMGLAVAAKHRPEDIENHREYVQNMCDKYLNKMRKFVFVLPARFPERVGTKPTEEWPVPRLTVVMNEEFKVLENVIETFPGVSEPKAHAESLTQVLQLVADSNPDKCQGYYIRPRYHTLQTKIYSKTYFDRLQIRGNVASLPFAYMLLRKNMDKLTQFVDTYREFDWKSMEKNITETCSDILELERGNTSVIPFDYHDFLKVVRRFFSYLTFRTLMDYSKTAPVVFNKAMKNRRQAHRMHQFREENECVNAEEDANRDMFEQMEALEQFEYDIGTRQQDQ